MSKNPTEPNVSKTEVPAVKAKTKTGARTVSFIEGLVAGAIMTLTTGVVLSKTAKVNLTDATSSLVDKGVSKVKAVSRKFKESKIEDSTEE
jgi:hypothetical protein